jgi:hemerythrin
MGKMQLFNFDNEFKLGIEQIDKEHAGLVNMLNEVHILIRENEKAKARDFFRDTLSAFIEQHFAHEEAFLQDIGYPQLEEHKKIHAQFRQSMEATLSHLDSEDDTVFRNGLTDVYTWIINHIGKTDRKYAAYLEASRK